MSQPRQPYFQRPAGLFGIFLIAFVALFGGAFSTQSRLSRGLAGTPVAEQSTTGKAINPLGSQSNPVPIGSTFLIDEGRLRLNTFTRALTADMEALNTFNPDPDPDEEWVILNLTYFCDLPEDQRCDLSRLFFELVGRETTYNNNMVMFLNNEFAGSVPGGGALTGNLGFIINQADVALLLVTDQIGQIYFSTSSISAASP